MNAAPRFRILYVCTANRCRSVLAERLTRQGVVARLGAVAERFDIGSAGTEAIPGTALHPYVREVLRDRAADTTGFASRWLTPGLVVDADLVLTAAAAQRDRVIAMVPAALRRSFTMAEFSRLAGHAGPAGGERDPVIRARSAVAAAQAMRGRTPYVDPTGDDVPDPPPTLAAFAACADRITAVVAEAVDALCPAPSILHPDRVTA